MLSSLPRLSIRSLAVTTSIRSNRIVYQSTVEALSEKQSDDEAEFLKAKSFDQIPGPKGLPFIGPLHEVLKNDRYYQKRMHRYFQLNSEKYGPIFKIKIGPVLLVSVHKPEDVAKVFQAEGKYPSRGPTIPWVAYREQRKRSNGLLTGEGAEWRKFRSIMDKTLLKVKNVSAYADRMNDIVTDLITHLKHKQNENVNGEIDELKDCLYKWSFETITAVLYNKRLGTFEDPPNTLARQFYQSVCSMLDKSNDLMAVPPYYKYVKTKTWKEYCQVWDTLFQIAGQLVTEEYNRLQQIIHDNSSSSIQSIHLTEEMEFLPYVLSRGELGIEEITGNVIDLMIGGVDTSANTILWVLYTLGKNDDIQEKVYQEIRNVLKKREHPDTTAIQKMPYLKGLIKECQRMYPVIIAVPRVIEKDIVLRGYQIPAKSTILANYYLSSYDESLHDEPTKIKPERWIRSSSQHRLNPFSYIPFGFGPRMCIGRRISELEMQILIARLISEFRLECRNTTEVDMALRTVACPNTDIRIALEPRAD